MTHYAARRGRVWLGVLAAMMGAAARAQVTETPRTIAPGKVLVRMDGIKLSLDRADEAGNTYSAVGVASTIVSTGLAANVDVQVGFDLFYREKVEYRTRASESDSGFGDFSVRMKWRFWRDEEWGASAALLPYVRVPTNRIGPGDRVTEFGLIVPWEMMRSGGFTAGAMARWDVVQNDARNGHDSQWGASAFARQELALGFMVYAEANFAVSSSGFSNSIGELGVGAQWKWSERLLLDYELLKGLNARASDWTHVLRLNWEW